MPIVLQKSETAGDKFPARNRNKPRSLIDVASGSLPKSPVSLSPGDEVPHMFTRKPRLQLEKFAINGAKRLLQHNLPDSDIGRIVQSPPRQAGAASAKLEAERVGGVTPDASCPSQGKIIAMSSASGRLAPPVGTTINCLPFSM